jgi:hypothetical protein
MRTVSVPLGQLLYEFLVRRMLPETPIYDWSKLSPDVRAAWELVAADLYQRKIEVGPGVRRVRTGKA